MKKIDENLGQLGGVRKVRDGWTAQCRVHDDRRPSLSVGVSPTGKPLACCHAGCTQASLRNAPNMGPASPGSRDPQIEKLPPLDLELLPPPDAV